MFGFWWFVYFEEETVGVDFGEEGFAFGTVVYGWTFWVFFVGWSEDSINGVLSWRFRERA